jgi:probable F420-dependent oxidoreductase
MTAEQPPPPPPRNRLVRFGAQVTKGESAAAWGELAWAIEDHGFDTLSMPDHLGAQLGPISALSYAAARTSMIRLTMSVLDNDFRHPAILAKEVATLDLLSSGRVELGLGAGWMTEDYNTSGIPFDPPGVRIERLAEAVTVVRGLLSPGPFTFGGRHYHVSALEGYPRPVQNPVPLMIGGGGPRLLTLASSAADIVAIAMQNSTGQPFPANAADTSRESFAKKAAIVEKVTAEHGRNPEIAVRVMACEVTDDRKGATERIAQAWSVAPEVVQESPYVLVGSPDGIVEHIHRLAADFGVTYYVSSFPAAMQLGPVIARLKGTMV